MADNLTQEFWAVRWKEGRTPWDLGQASLPARQLAQTHMRPGQRVLIPGSGRGHEALLLASLGCRVTAVDFVAEPIAILKQAAADRGLAVDAVQSDIFALPATLDGTFDAVLEQTCLAALGPERFAAYEALVFRMLRPGGLLLGVFMEVTGIQPPPFTCPPDAVQALFAPPRWVSHGFHPVTPQNPARPGPEYIAVFERAGA